MNTIEVFFPIVNNTFSIRETLDWVNERFGYDPYFWDYDMIWFDGDALFFNFVRILL